MNTIGLACDHAGYDFKIAVKNFLLSRNIQVVDFGCNSAVSCDYPDFAHKIGYAIDNKDVNIGFVFCGSGNGINMTVNKHVGVRSALCWNKEIAYLARHHNDANVCSIPSRFVSLEDALMIVDVFLTETFDGGRHLLRVQNIPV